MSERLKRYWVAKQASLVGDYVGGMNLTPVHALANIPGTLHGLTTDDSEVPDTLAGIVPGIGGSRLMRRQRNVRKELLPESLDQKSRIAAEGVGTITSTLLLALAAGTVGAMNGRHLQSRMQAFPGAAGRGFRKGANLGTGVGAGAMAVALIAAALTSRRTYAEQLNAEKQPVWKSMVLPGYSVYNQLKRLGVSDELNPDGTRKKKA